MENTSRTYVDANPFIAALNDQGELGERVRKVLKKGNFVTSALTLDEVMFFVQKTKGKGKVFRAINNIYNSSNITVLPVNAGAPLEAAKLLAEYNLRPRDAIHLATMRELGVHQILSYDKDFDSTPGIIRTAP